MVNDGAVVGAPAPTGVCFEISSEISTTVPVVKWEKSPSRGARQERPISTPRPGFLLFLKRIFMLPVDARRSKKPRIEFKVNRNETLYIGDNNCN